jgi:hypothetical protein
VSKAEISWEEVDPYLTRHRYSRELGAERAVTIAAVLRRTLKCQQIEIRLRGESGPGAEYGSCTRFTVFFDDQWCPLETVRPSLGQGKCIGVLVSERGPFVTSKGAHWLVEPNETGGTCLVIAPGSADAAAKAKASALDVAAEFGLTYLDADWLRQFKLKTEDLPWEDVRSSLDLDEPDALNILFDEEV